MPVPVDPKRLAPSQNPLALVEAPSLRDTGTAAIAVQATPNESFILAHSPGDWEAAIVDGVPTWIPVLYAVPIRPGVCGVRTLSRYEQPEQAVRDAIRWVENRGHVVIYPTSIVPASCAGALGEGPYMRKIACRPNPHAATGARYFQVFAVPVPTPPGEDQAFVFDHESSKRWRAHLVLTGVVAPPSALIVERARRGAGTRTARVLSQPYPDAALKKERVAAAQARAKEIMTAALPGDKVVA